MYQGLFNSSYVPTELELAYINDPIYNYAEQQNKDPPHLRFLVYFSFLLCTAKSADTFAIAVSFLSKLFSAPYLRPSREQWQMFVKQFGNYSSVRTSYWLEMERCLVKCLLQLAGDWTLDKKASIAWGSLIGLFVQSYFIYRTFMLSRSWCFLVIASLTALSGFVASIILSALAPYPIGYYALAYPVVAGIMVFGTVLADGLITGFTCFYFLKQSKMTVFSGTKELLARLTAVSMQSAVPPLICAILNLVFNFRFYEPDAPWAYLFNILMPYLYVISLLFTLNSRSNCWSGGRIQNSESNTDGQGSAPLGPTDFRWIDQSEHRATEVHISITSQSQQDSTKMRESKLFRF
ncbi:hypothetical protein FRC10_011770 [Ceratobasidium sp. 414]|nr:hypothetical protein FRC10_011770 [Ceratobasidium sp. 414]